MRLILITEGRKPDVCVDLDGLLATYDHWRGHEHIGEPYPGTKEFLKELSKIANIIVLTSRCSERKSADKIIKKWFKDNGLPEVTIWTGRGKPPAAAYVDDRAVYCVPKHGRSAYTKALTRIKSLIKKHPKDHRITATKVTD